MGKKLWRLIDQICHLAATIYCIMQPKFPATEPHDAEHGKLPETPAAGAPTSNGVTAAAAAAAMPPSAANSPSPASNKPQVRCNSSNWPSQESTRMSLLLLKASECSEMVRDALAAGMKKLSNSQELERTEARGNLEAEHQLGAGDQRLQLISEMDYRSCCKKVQCLSAHEELTSGSMWMLVRDVVNFLRFPQEIISQLPLSRIKQHILRRVKLAHRRAMHLTRRSLSKLQSNMPTCDPRLAVQRDHAVLVLSKLLRSPEVFHMLPSALPLMNSDVADLLMFKVHDQQMDAQAAHEVVQLVQCHNNIIKSAALMDKEMQSLSKMHPLFERFAMKYDGIAQVIHPAHRDHPRISARINILRHQAVQDIAISLRRIDQDTDKTTDAPEEELQSNAPESSASQLISAAAAAAARLENQSEYSEKDESLGSHSDSHSDSRLATSAATRALEVASTAAPRYSKRQSSKRRQQKQQQQREKYQPNSRIKKRTKTHR